MLIHSMVTLCFLQINNDTTSFVTEMESQGASLALGSTITYILLFHYIRNPLCWVMLNTHIAKVFCF